MQAYKIYDIALESTVPFPELRSTEYQQPKIKFCLQPTESDRQGTCNWSRRWCLPDGDTWLLIGKRETGYALRFPNLADFSVSTDAREIHCYPVRDVPIDTIRHLFLDQVLPLILSAWDRLVLHGSAIVSSHGAIAFIGRTGSGKSTMAFTFSAKDWSVLTDDCLLVDLKNGQILATPSYPGIRLWPGTVNALFGPAPSLSNVAHYSEKKRLGHDVGIRFCTAPTALRRVFFLGNPCDTNEASEITICPLSASDALIELIKYTYVLDIGHREMLRRVFEFLSHAATLPLFYRLAFPHDFSTLARVQEFVMEILRHEEL